MGDTWHYRIERERMGGFKAVVLIQHFNYDHLGLKKKSSAQDAPRTNELEFLKNGGWVFFQDSVPLLLRENAERECKRSAPGRSGQIKRNWPPKEQLVVLK